MSALPLKTPRAPAIYASPEIRRAWELVDRRNLAQATTFLQWFGKARFEEKYPEVDAEKLIKNLP